MLITILGLIISLIPFVAIVCFRSRLAGVLTVFASASAFHLLVALITQSVHAFTYPVVLCLHVVFAVIALYIAFKYRQPATEKVSVHWFFLCSLLIVLSLLVSVHYFYTGIVDDGFGGRMVNRSSYTYPLYSDEWSAVAFIKYSIESGSLPFANSLNYNFPFINFLAGFHSLVSEIVLLLGLNPLTQYVWLAIANGILTCILVFAILRRSGVGLYASSAVMMTVPFITTSGNLASIIYFIPYSLSFVFLLTSILGFLMKNRVVTFLSLIISLIIYPPMIVFALPVCLVVALYKQYKFIYFSKWFYLGLIILVSLFFLIVASLSRISFTEMYDLFVSFLIRGNPNDGVVSFKFWDVLPIFSLPFICVGAYYLIKKKEHNIILVPTLVGLAFWIFFSFYQKTFLIERTRIVSITSIFLILIGGLGLERAIKYVKENYDFSDKIVFLRSLRIIVLALFIILSFFFSKIGLWHKLSIEIENNAGKTQRRIPSPPVTRYLSEKDLELFRDIRAKRFISPRWKGLVIGVATGNYPLDSKTSTITNKILVYSDFINANCEQKDVYANKFKIDFAYTKAFSCSNFQEIGIGPEGLVLYRIIR